jgi:hypothetical protein
MKSLLIMLLISICAIAWRSDDIRQILGAAQQAASPATAATLTAGAPTPGRKPEHKPMSVAEFQELSKTDPQAYHKLINSMRVQEDRGAIDKLMNFLAHGEYQ